jgi:ABC-type enterobactin transport system permease subunit
VLLGATVAAALGALTVGSVFVPPGEVLLRCWAAAWGTAEPDTVQRILLVARLPRVVMAGATGAVLALTGLSAQAMNLPFPERGSNL